MNETETQDDEREQRQERLEKLIQSHCSQLMEHFASVRIVAVHVNGESGETARISRGAGDYYSQYGAVKDWLIYQDEQTRIDAGKD